MRNVQQWVDEAVDHFRIAGEDALGTILYNYTRLADDDQERVMGELNRRMQRNDDGAVMLWRSGVRFLLQQIATLDQQQQLQIVQGVRQIVAAPLAEDHPPSRSEQSSAFSE